MAGQGNKNRQTLGGGGGGSGVVVKSVWVGIGLEKGIFSTYSYMVLYSFVHGFVQLYSADLNYPD